MVEWDGSNLPPIAAARIERARNSGVKTSLLSVAGNLGVRAAALDPVGEVMGCIVEYIGFQGYGGCGYYPMGGGYGMPASTITSSASSGYAGYGPYVDALNAGWDTAIGRMLLEAKALGADGVVDVRLSEQHLGNQRREFVALGTAVRARGGVHLQQPFTTTLSGQDTAKLFARGYAPASIIVAISVAVRHDDYQTRLAAATLGVNMEVPGYTELVHHVRMDARHVLERRAASHGADGVILTSPMGLAIWEVECAAGRDHIGEASCFAASIVHVRDVPEEQSAMTLSLK